jgi:hydroxymethylglutaryl-CoA lyase
MKLEQECKLVECPRDAMQGIETFIPTAIKIAYLNKLLKVGFDTLDFGSFVSPKAIPQMADTFEVLQGLDMEHSPTRLLAIMANLRGAELAVSYPQITYLGFPLSLSETFQQRNTHKSIQQAIDELISIQDLCLLHKKVLVVYLSMGFGNPYGDPYSVEQVAQQVNQLYTMGVSVISFADTVGLATPEQVKDLYTAIVPAFPAIEFGVHLHCRPDTAYAKLEASWNAGCRRFDGTIGGYGGCPMAEDTLTGNMPTETILQFLSDKGVKTEIDGHAFDQARLSSPSVFNWNH